MDQLNVRISAYAAIIRLVVDIKDSWTMPKGVPGPQTLGEALIGAMCVQAFPH